MFRSKYPYTDFHELNLDYLLNQYVKLKKEIENLKKEIKEIKEEMGAEEDGTI